MMKKVLALGVMAFMMLLGAKVSCAAPAADNYDVFIPIAKYIRLGDAERLSAWFDDNLEITILSKTNTCSRNQAKQIVKQFFDSYKPRDFEINHTAGRDNMKYAIGNLGAGGEKFEVTIFVNLKNNNYRIKIFKIEKKDY